MSSRAGVLAAMYFINRNFQYRGYCSLYEFYEMLGIENCPFIDRDAAMAVGWDIENLVNDYDAYFIDFDFGPTKEENHYILAFPYAPKLLDSSYTL